MPAGDRGGAQTKKLTPAQVAHLQQAVRALHEQEFKQRRYQTQRALAVKVNKGEMSPLEARKHLQQAGFLPGRVGKNVPLKGLGGLAAKTVGELAQAAVYSPAGFYGSGKAVVGDVKGAGHGDLSFKRSRHLAAQIARSTAADIRHPLRHPGFTVLDALALVSAGAGTGVRVGAAGRALGAGEGVARAVGRSSAKGGSLLHAPNPGRLTVREGDLSVEVPAFRNPSARLVQKAYHAGKLGRAKPGLKNVAKALAAERRVTEPLERAPAGALAAKGARLTTPQQKALQVVAEGQPIDARIRLHLKDARTARPAVRARLRNEVRLLKAARTYVEDVNGKPRLRKEFQTPLLGGRFRTRRGVGPAGLQDVYRQAGKVNVQREKTLTDAGRLDPSQVEARLHGPGRVIEGANYVKTSAVKGRAEQVRSYPGRSRTVTRPRTLTEAQARLAALDAKYEKAVAAISEKINPYSDKRAMQREQLYRNSKKTRQRRPGLPTVSKEVRALAEDRLFALAEKHPEQSFAKDILERHDLRNALNDRALGGSTHIGDLTETIPGKPRSVRLREIKAQRASAKLVGAEEFKGGEMYVPYRRNIAPRAHAQAAQYRGGIPLAPASTKHAFTGGALRSGNYRNRTSQVIAEAGVEAQRYGSLLRLRDQVLKAAHDVKPDDGQDYVPVRTGTGPKSPSLTSLQAKAEEGIALSKQERQTLGKSADALATHLFPDPSTLASHEGIKWVPKQLLDGLNDPHGQLSAVIGSRAVKVWDAINNGTRAAILYLKPAYATPNLLGNAALNILQQGFAAIPNLARAAHANAALGPDALTALDAGMGEGFAQALAGDTGLGTKAIQGLANTWSKGVDTPFRRAAFIYEARRLGYKSPGQQARLLLDDARHADRVEAFQRANKAIIDYSRLGKREKEIVRRVVFFYPWVKGSTMYAGHFVTEHPIKAALTAQEGRQGQAQAQKDLGPVPSYAEGLFKVGQRGDTPMVVNPAAASLLGTPAQVAQALLAQGSGNVRKVDALTNFLTPSAGLGVDLLTHRDAFTGQTLHGNLLQNLKTELVGGLPQLTLAQRLKHPSDSQKMFPMNRRDAMLQFLVGSIAPKPANVASMRQKAYQEKSASLKPAERAYRSVYKERNDLYAKAVDKGILKKGEKLPRPLVDAFKYKAERDAMWAAAAHGHNPGTPGYELAKYKADITFLRKYKVISQKQAHEWSATAEANADDPELLKKARSWISHHYYSNQGSFLDTIRAGKKYVGG